MAAVTVRSLIFPEGTSVAAYYRHEVEYERQRTLTPIPSSEDTATVDSDNTATFDLGNGEYVCTGVVDSVRRYVNFIQDAA